MPRLQPESLMPQLESNGLRTLSLFSGGGGLDIGFERAGFLHVASIDYMEAAGDTLRRNRPQWHVLSGEAGDVQQVDWSQWQGDVDILHGGPPCQPFSMAGKQQGSADARDMVPAFVQAVQTIKPTAWVMENVTALVSAKFYPYVEQVLLGPLGKDYEITQCVINAQSFGVPQRRKRVFFVGTPTDQPYTSPTPTHRFTDGEEDLPVTQGVRRSLGLPSIGHDAPAPTLRSALTGKRHTTSILSSSSAAKQWAQLEVWPNGVSLTRAAAKAFPVQNGHYRLSVPDCKILQGFPAAWNFAGPAYMQLGQLGNSVAPPVAYAVASELAATLAT